MNSQITLNSYSLQDTAQLGIILSNLIPNGAVISLTGTLGAGKTALVRAIAVANGENPDDVSSPTFVLIQEYSSGLRPIYHFDAYRIQDDDEFLELGPEEYFDSNGITFVEWADRVKNCLPENVITIDVTQTGESSRQYTIGVEGSIYSDFLDNLSKILKNFV